MHAGIKCLQVEKIHEYADQIMMVLQTDDERHKIQDTLVAVNVNIEVTWTTPAHAMRTCVRCKSGLYIECVNAEGHAWEMISWKQHIVRHWTSNDNDTGELIS